MDGDFILGGAPLGQVSLGELIVVAAVGVTVPIFERFYRFMRA